MTIQTEIQRLGWRVLSYAHFSAPRPAILGWFSNHNLGDDAALYSLNWHFSNKLAVITPQTYRRIPSNLRLLICGAGGWLNQEAPRHFLKYITRIKKRSFPCLFLSGGINRDYVDRNYQRLFPQFKQFLSHFEYIGVRDLMSQRFVEETLGFKDTRLVPDFVLSLPGEEHLSPPRGNEKTVGLVLATHNETFRHKQKEMYVYLLAMSDELISKGYKIICIPFQIDLTSVQSKSVDERQGAMYLKNSLRYPDQFEVLERMMSPSETLSYIQKNIGVVISMRLHGNVMAARAGVPFISLSYSDKHAGFLELMEMSEFDVALKEEVLDPVKLFDALKRIEVNYEQVSRHISDKRSELAGLTQKAVDWIREKYQV